MEETLIGVIRPESGLDGVINAESSVNGVINQVSGLTGVLSVAGEPVIIEGEIYIGPYQAIPKAFEQTILETQDKYMADDVIVHEIPYQEVSSGEGRAIIIAS